MEEIKELKLKEKNIERYIEDRKEAFKKMFNTKNVKFVGIVFRFLIDDELLSDIKLYSKGFNPEDWEGD